MVEVEAPFMVSALEVDPWHGADMPCSQLGDGTLLYTALKRRLFSSCFVECFFMAVVPGERR